jgi:hypothetical protein
MYLQKGISIKLREKKIFFAVFQIRDVYPGSPDPDF